MKQLLLTFTFLLLTYGLQAQTGREFWFVAPDVTSDHNDQPIEISLSAYDDSAYVQLSQPANPSFIPIAIGIPANQSTTIDLTPFINDIESLFADSVLNNGIYINATNNISAYYEVAPSNNTDIFSLKGENAMGTEFLVSAQSFFNSATKYTPKPFNSVGIVASEDNTVVSITPSQNIVGHPAGVTFTITLNQGQTFILKALGPATTDRFGGTVIRSTAPVAVSIADDSVESSYGGCKDILGDQTIPTNQLGKEYILVRGFLGTNADRIYAMGTKDNTFVMVDGGGPNDFIINRGQSYELALTNATLHLQADNDIYVMHVTGFGCEVGMAILPSVYCTGSKEVSFVRSQPGNFYIIAFVPAGAEGNFTVNGSTSLLAAADFAVVPGTGGQWMAARKYFTTAQIVQGQNYRVKNANERFHLGIINGGSTSGCLYGYFSDFSVVKTPPIYRY